jgi:glycosyltransferase involved in cell wall biosynthesis
MLCPTLKELPLPPLSKQGWPWTEETPQLPDTMPSALCSLPDGSPWPKVSIVTPSYNQGHFIEETIRSVLLQGYPNLEYIIIDGGSTDDTVDIIRKYEPWLSYWVSEPDDGQADAINKGWQRSTGEIIGWINSDDILMPGAINAVTKILLENPEVDLVYGDNVYLDEYSVQSVILRGEAIEYKKMLRTLHVPMPQPGCLMKRKTLDKVGYLNAKWRVLLDRDYFVRIGLVGKTYYYPSVLAGFRLHGSSKTISERKSWVNELPEMYREFFIRDDLPSEIKKLKRETISSAYFAAAQFAIKTKQSVFLNLFFSIFYFPLKVFNFYFWLFLWEYVNSRTDNKVLRIFSQCVRKGKTILWNVKRKVVG